MKTFEDFLEKHPEVKYTQNNINNIKTKIDTSKNNIQNTKRNIKHTNSNSKNEKIEEFDKLKTKVLKYVLYKKRTEQEIKQKFSSEIDENLLEDIIQDLKENGYISDTSYIQRAVNEFMAIKTLSIKEIYMKLYAKGISSNTIEEYFNENQEILEQYEISCAKKIILKKSSQMEEEEIKNFLYKKGYKSENIKIAFEEEGDKK